MKKYLIKLVTTLIFAGGFIASAHAVPVTINMTADNIIFSGGLCADASCQSGTVGWSGLVNADNWTQSDSQVFDLSVGTYSFAWQVNNVGGASNGNPAALLAEILWDGNANYSSSSWEVYDQSTGNFLANATEYGLNGGANIWNDVNGGPVAGISTNANWIYTMNNFADVDSSAWIRTSITVTAVPEPAVLGLFGLGLIGLAVTRRKRAV